MLCRSASLFACVRLGYVTTPLYEASPHGPCLLIERLSAYFSPGILIIPVVFIQAILHRHLFHTRAAGPVSLPPTLAVLRGSLDSLCSSPQPHRYTSCAAEFYIGSPRPRGRFSHLRSTGFLLSPSLIVCTLSHHPFDHTCVRVPLAPHQLALHTPGSRSVSNYVP